MAQSKQIHLLRARQSFDLPDKVVDRVGVCHLSFTPIKVENKHIITANAFFKHGNKLFFRDQSFFTIHA